jgi:hypothetical protein
LRFREIPLGGYYIMTKLTDAEFVKLVKKDKDIPSTVRKALVAAYSPTKCKCGNVIPESEVVAGWTKCEHCEGF